MSEAPVVHEFQIRESDPWYGEFVATEGETWFVFAHEFKAYREWVIKMSGELQAKVADVQVGVSALKHERDAWKRVAEHAGVCMTCALGAPDISIGCTDCLNTGFAHGAPQGYVSEGFHAEQLAAVARKVSTRQCYNECGDAGCAYPTNCAAVPVVYRDLDATALAEAEARGRRQGLEEAARLAEDTDVRRQDLSSYLRSLATTPAETQKPETGESA